MSTLPLRRTEYLNLSTGGPRTGATAHGESLTDIESYLLHQAQNGNATLHFWGVADGLTVTAVPAATEVTIAPGVALDFAGQQIALAPDGFAVVDPTVDPDQVANVPFVPVTAGGVVLPTTGLTGDQYLTIKHREVLDPSSVGNAPTLVHAPWLRLQPVADVVDNGDVVILARVSLDAGSTVTALTADLRRAAGLPASRLELRLPRTATGSTLAVGQEPAGEVRLAADGGLRVNLLPGGGTTKQVLTSDAAASTLALLPAGGSVAIGGPTTIGGAATITGGATISGATTIGSNIGVNGSATIAGAATIGGTVGISGGANVGGQVGVGLRGTPPRRVVHAEGNEIHSGGAGAGFSFANRDTGSFVESPANGERWIWYAAGGTARLWTGIDRLTIAPAGSGLQLMAGAAGSVLQLAAQGGNLGKLALSAGNITARRADGTEPILLDTVNGRVGIGTTAPANPLHVNGSSGIRQNRLYLGGDAGWSSLTYNAFHNDTNNGWIFPDTGRPSVTLEIDDNGGTPRFQVFSTTTSNTQAYQFRFGVNGNTGEVSVPGSLTVGTGANLTGIVSIRTTAPNPALTASLNVTSAAGTAICGTAQGASSVAVVGFSTAAGGVGLQGWGGPAGDFIGNVSVTGTLSAGAKQFVIDHPLDPDNKVLTHASVESSERAVVYSGNVTCDKEGKATVALPAWLEALATDFRYQLTCLDAHAPVYVSRQVQDNSFEVGGGTAGLTVSWQLIGVRQDPWAKLNDLVVEDDKPKAERGFYLAPEAFGKTMTASVHWPRNEELIKAHPSMTQQMVRRYADHEARRATAQETRRAQARAAGQPPADEAPKPPRSPRTKKG